MKVNCIYSSCNITINLYCFSSNINLL